MRSTHTPNRSTKRTTSPASNGKTNGQAAEDRTAVGDSTLNQAALQTSDEPATPTCSDSFASQQIEVSPARTGDHMAIFHLLQNVFHAPSAAEFQAAHDAPLYEPSDRLVARHGPRLLGQVHTANRVMYFDSLELPIAEVRHLGVLPEFRGRGIGGRLLEAAEERITEEGGRLAILQTSEPEFFMSRGWVVCGRHSYSTASARNILAHMADAEDPEKSATERSPLAPPRTSLNVRLWRQIEQDAIANLYRTNAKMSRGCIQRSHAYWRWLVSRHAYDRIYVAVEGNAKPNLDAPNSPIVGYAVLRDARILELQSLPEYPQAAEKLVARACGDAIERGEPAVRLDAPPENPTHRLVQQAGGRFSCRHDENGEVLMAKLFDPLWLLRQLRGDIFNRARRRGLSLPVDLGLLIDGQKYQLNLTRRSAKLTEGKLGRSYLISNRREFCRLLLGEFDVAKAEAAGAIEVSTRVALDVARVLFPQRPLWFPPLDHHPAD